MKKRISRFVMLLFASLSLAAQQELSDSSNPKVPNIVVIGNDAAKSKWLIRTAESQYSVLLYDMKIRKMLRFPIGEENILSAQFISIPYVKESLIEIVSSTNKGDGYLYVFNTAMRPLLQVRYFDSRRETLDYAIYGKLKISEKLGDVKTPVSRIYRDNHLNINYDADVKNKTIKVSGYCDYLTAVANGETTVYTEYVEKTYRYSDTAKEFLYQAGESYPENESWPVD
ncbi:MAG TPA: hypothetical protein PKO22_09570 [Treponemataceae bacterium]|nr:hypothetical protein [Treponemataceae bacterium]